MLSYLDRQTLSVAAPVIREEMGSALPRFSSRLGDRLHAVLAAGAARQSAGEDDDGVTAAAAELVPVIDESHSPLGEILRGPIFWSLAVASIFLNPVQYSYMSWLPTYYAEAGEGLGVATKLILAYLLYDLGLYLSGALVIWLSRKRPVPRARLISVGWSAGL